MRADVLKTSWQGLQKTNTNLFYRALEFLEKNGYIFSFDFENEKYYFKEENANFFICGSCKHIETVPEFSNEETEKEKSELKKRGFSLLSHLSIFKGKCSDCD